MLTKVLPLIVAVVCAVIVIAVFTTSPFNPSNELYQLDVTAFTERGTVDSLGDNRLVVFYGPNYSQSSIAREEYDWILVTPRAFAVGETVRIVMVEGSVVYHPYTSYEVYQYTVVSGGDPQYPIAVAKWDCTLITEPTTFP